MGNAAVHNLYIVFGAAFYAFSGDGRANIDEMVKRGGFLIVFD